MSIINNINFLKKIGLTNIDTMVMKKIENDKSSYIERFINFNFYQILTYLIYQKINVKRKPQLLQTINLKSRRKNLNDLQIFTNETGLNLQTNILLQPLFNAKNTICRSYRITSNIYQIRILNLKPEKKYLLFLPVDVNNVNTNVEYVKCHNYLFFYIEKKNFINIDLSNVLNKTIHDSKLIILDSIGSNVIDVAKNVLTCDYKITNKPFLLGKMIAIWQRASLVVSILDEEEGMQRDFEYCNILGYSNTADIKHIKNNLKNKENTFYFYTPNDTLGLKWQHIAEFTKLLNLNYILIQGSDDKILLNKLNKNLITSYNFNGQRQWYIHDTRKNNFYLLTLKYLIQRGALCLIGAGRIINKNEAIKYNYNLFNPQSFKGLDQQINTIAVKIQNKIIGEPICCSLKGKHGCLNSLPKYLNSGNNTYELINKI